MREATTAIAAFRRRFLVALIETSDHTAKSHAASIRLIAFISK